MSQESTEHTARPWMRWGTCAKGEHRLGGLRYRSGSVGLLNLGAINTAEVQTALERARFQVIPMTAHSATDIDTDAIVVGDDSEIALTTSLQTYRASCPHTALIAVLSAGPQVSQRLLSSFRAGADDAILMPDGLSELLSTIRLSMERRSLVASHDRQSATFVRELGKRTRSLKTAYEQLDEAYEETLLALVRALDTREQATAGHSARVALYSLRLAVILGEPQETLQSLYQGALLHDIGKIGIPDNILLKPGRLTKAEFEVMKTHTTLAAGFLEGIPHLRDSLRIPVYHHERFDGSGYPYQVVGASIPMQARIFAVVDVYDALRSKRPYKGPMDHQDVIAMLQVESGKHFDPQVLAAFLSQPLSVWQELERHCERLPRFDRALTICHESDKALLTQPHGNRVPIRPQGNRIAQ